MSSPLQNRQATYSGVVFLDRDGVINRDSPEYVKSWAEFAFLPGSLEALRLLHQNGYIIILITNQSMINRGLAPLTNLEKISSNMCREVEQSGGHITDILFCPHRPDENCDCRKPKPGLIFQAQIRHAVDLQDSILVGDSAKDILCARNAGCGKAILVETGNGSSAYKELAGMTISPDLIAANLLEAARFVISGFTFDQG